MSKYYIAYGSNMNLKQMAERCPTAERIGIGKVKNYELQFKGSEYNAFATISEKSDQEVDVLLWKVQARDEAALDCYEGYPTFYGKQDFEVELEDGTVVQGMAYVMDPKHKFGYPSLQYFRTIEERYMENGIDISPLIQALENNQEYIYKQDEQLLKQEM